MDRKGSKMKFLLPLILSVAAGCSSLTEIERQEIAYKNKFDMTKATLLIEGQNGLECLATLISETKAITSAGCVYNKPFSVKVIRLNDDERTSLELNIKKVDIHPDFNPNTIEPHKSIAVIEISPSKAIRKKYIEFPVPLLFKSSHYSHVKNAETQDITHYDSLPKIAKVSTSKFFTNGMAFGNLSLPIDNILPGSVSVIKYHGQYMITGMKVGAIQPANDDVNFAALYKSRSFLSKHVRL